MVYHFSINSKGFLYNVAHNVIIHQRCLGFERSCNVFHVPPITCSPYVINAPLPTSGGEVRLKLLCVFFQSFLQSQEFCKSPLGERGRFSPITIKVSV